MGNELRWPSVPSPRWVDATAPHGLQHRALATRRAILLAAARVIDEHGYNGASLQAITAAQGGSRGALYFHFTSKRALAEALVAEVIEAWRDVLARIDDLGLDPLQTLLVYYDAYTARLMHDTTARAALRVVQDDVGRHHATMWAAAWEKTVGDVLRRAHDEGLLRSAIDPAWLSRLILASTTGHFQLASGKATGPTMWERMTDTWFGLLPAVATAQWLDTWHTSGWSTRDEPTRDSWQLLAPNAGNRRAARITESLNSTSARELR